jgi:hypothetical protein
MSVSPASEFLVRIGISAFELRSDNPNLRLIARFLA